jgi:hypothetical protein
MVIGRPLRNTIRAASGSTQMLNSAAGVQFPARMLPPIRDTWAIFEAISGYVLSRSAILVSGPVGISVTGAGAAASVARRNSRAPSGRGDETGSGRSAPSRPLTPWTSGAVSRRRTSGCDAPAATGTSARPSSASTRRAFSVVAASGALPPTVVIPRTSSSGRASASVIASASS